MSAEEVVQYIALHDLSQMIGDAVNYTVKTRPVQPAACLSEWFMQRVKVLVDDVTGVGKSVRVRADCRAAVEIVCREEQEQWWWEKLNEIKGVDVKDQGELDARILKGIGNQPKLVWDVSISLLKLSALAYNSSLGNRVVELLGKGEKPKEIVFPHLVLPVLKLEPHAKYCFLKSVSVFPLNRIKKRSDLLQFVQTAQDLYQTVSDTFKLESFSDIYGIFKFLSELFSSKSVQLRAFVKFQWESELYQDASGSYVFDGQTMLSEALIERYGNFIELFPFIGGFSGLFSAIDKKSWSSWILKSEAKYPQIYNLVDDSFAAKDEIMNSKRTQIISPLLVDESGTVSDLFEKFSSRGYFVQVPSSIFDHISEVCYGLAAANSESHSFLAYENYFTDFSMQVNKFLDYLR